MWRSDFYFLLFLFVQCSILISCHLFQVYQKLPLKNLESLESQLDKAGLMPSFLYYCIQVSQLDLPIQSLIESYYDFLKSTMIDFPSTVPHSQPALKSLVSIAFNATNCILTRETPIHDFMGNIPRILLTRGSLILFFLIHPDKIDSALYNDNISANNLFCFLRQIPISYDLDALAEMNFKDNCLLLFWILTKPLELTYEIYSDIWSVAQDFVSDYLHLIDSPLNIVIFLNSLTDYDSLQSLSWHNIPYCDLWLNIYKRIMANDNLHSAFLDAIIETQLDDLILFGLDNPKLKWISSEHLRLLCQIYLHEMPLNAFKYFATRSLYFSKLSHRTKYNLVAPKNFILGLDFIFEGLEPLTFISFLKDAGIPYVDENSCMNLLYVEFVNICIAIGKISRLITPDLDLITFHWRRLLARQCSLDKKLKLFNEALSNSIGILLKKSPRTCGLINMTEKCILLFDEYNYIDYINRTKIRQELMAKLADLRLETHFLILSMVLQYKNGDPSFLHLEAYLIELKRFFKNYQKGILK
jgi:hypothetical protein